MSVEFLPSAWKTKLGSKSSAAKTVLMFLCDAADPHGASYPSVRYIAERIERSTRTVQRVIQVFEDIGLIERVDRYGKNGSRLNDTFQLSVEKLGTDLRKEFAAAFKKAQSKSHDAVSTSVSGDAAASVFGDADGCLVRHRDASPATLPPHPLKGGTVSEPSGNYPQPPQAGASALTDQTIPFPDEGKSIENGIDQVMQGCGFANRRLRDTLRSVLLQESDKGVPLPTAGLSMIDAWKRYTSQGSRLRAKWRAAVFFGEGYWRDSQSWMWNTVELRDERMQMEARAGSR
jgi:hypothetical protein